MKDHHVAPDLEELIERLRSNDATLKGRSLTEWADPLDAAIMAALCLAHPVVEIQARAKAHPEEAEFWRWVEAWMLSITSEKDDGQALQ